MQLIHALELEPRGVYTGAIGLIAPGRRALLNVAIRTAVIDRAHGRASYGVGSGVVWDSDAAAEYDECLLKARVLQARPAPATDFRLLESLRWAPAKGYFLLGRHMERLRDSAEYFSFRFDARAVESALAARAATLAAPSKVRLLLDRAGRIVVEDVPLAHGERPQPVLVGLAKQPIDASDPFIYHKTDRRQVYDEARASRPDCDDVILWNERGELTEASASNLVLEIDGRRCTPPVSAGLLPGTLRAQLLAGGEIEERPLMTEDLARATGSWLINSVRGWQVALIKP